MLPLNFLIQNSGKEAIIDLLDGRMEVAEAQLANRISGDLYGNGTGNAGKNLTGLAAAVPDSPSTGTYGGINRQVWQFWRSVAFSATGDGTGAVTSSNIQGYMDAVAVQLIRGTDKPDPLVDVLLDMELSSDLEEGQHDAKYLRAKLDALGFEIREKNDDQ